MTPTRIAVIAAACGLLFALAAPAAHAAPELTAESWDQLPAKVTAAQPVWVPTNTLGMELHPTTAITMEPCGSKYVIDALYGGGTAVKPAPSFDISQQAGDACDLEPFSYYGKVDSVKTKEGTFIISAGCGWNAKAQKPVAGYNGGPCKKKDLKTDGGMISFHSNTGSKPAVQVATDGLAYGNLVAIAKGLRLRG